MENFKNWGENWPDWQDAGKRVELVMRDGSSIKGRLEVEDEFFTGDDEVPIFAVHTDDGVQAPFLEHEKWRFCK